MSAVNSAAAQAAALRAGARKGVWRRLVAFCGLRTKAMVRADVAAARWAHGAAGEAATARLVEPLRAEGWHVLHDRALPGSRANLDTILVTPCGTGVVVLDTKAWHRGRPTTLIRGRVCCGAEDRHRQVEAVVSYAHRVAAAVGIPVGHVAPLLVVHGSPIPGGHLAARVDGWEAPVFVLGADWLLSTLRKTAQDRMPNAVMAGQLARHAEVVLPRYLSGSQAPSA
ncbi:nuclease-related domain-containing protein [Streptomyces sp. NPDC058657]|uniref:nuclease-related domain-containing protein n=1 Tax=unclassified Streptomyces TaxID=2593676 RepID=UPI003651F45C